ncbi:hypothetical protein BLNAU_24189 [Blattamonas nauphoetae]|uniref:Uncharacterized protein n=1 Tax=Blattamonas nauphoetae TaxID=2049346 RepID=A0ABQ9WNH4_9EUKA|nr:hypothetical protein BLNAU_24189 [Blattamonas nauphoetae]
MALPPLLFTAPSHFIVRSSIITRTAGAITPKRSTNTSLILIGDPVTTGIVSVTMTILSLPQPIVSHSLSLSSSTGRINLKTPSTRRVTELPLNYSHLKGRSFVIGVCFSRFVLFQVHCFVQETSFGIDRIARQQRPTPIAPEMKDLTCQNLTTLVFREGY